VVQHLITWKVSDVFLTTHYERALAFLLQDPVPSASIAARIPWFAWSGGLFGAIFIGFVTASFTLVVGQYAFSVARSAIVRLVIGLLFALPAARAGYDATLAFAHIGVPSEWWREAFAVVGAITVGGTAWARMSIVRNPASREVVLRRSHLSRPRGQWPRAGDSEAPSSVRLGSAR